MTWGSRRRRRDEQFCRGSAARSRNGPQGTQSGGDGLIGIDYDGPAGGAGDRESDACRAHAAYAGCAAPEQGPAVGEVMD
jgi:hypothetical protein